MSAIKGLTITYMSILSKYSFETNIGLHVFTFRYILNSFCCVSRSIFIKTDIFMFSTHFPLPTFKVLQLV